MALYIDGLDTRQGIQLLGGEIKLYLEMLAVFHDDGQLRVGKIRECLEKRDLELFTTYIHALKSASANIGAGGLAATALELEMAGQRRDFEYVYANTENCIAGFEALLASIGDALSTHSAPHGHQVRPPCPLDARLFNEELSRLKAALENLDIGAIDRSVEVLMDTARTENQHDTAKKISKHILLGEYDEASALAEVSGGLVSGGRFC